MKNKIVIPLIVISMILFFYLYFKVNYVKLPYIGYVKLLKWDVSIGDHKVDSKIFYKRILTTNEVSEDQIIAYIEGEQKKSKLPQIIDLLDKNTLKKNLTDHGSIATSTVGSSDFLQKDLYKIIIQVKKIKSDYEYTISIENF